jgi:hypothetical protein
MYPPNPSSLMFVHEDSIGVNAPLKHQQVISRLHVELGILHYKKQSIPYEPLTETMLAEGYGNPTTLMGFRKGLSTIIKPFNGLVTERAMAE